MFSNRKLAFLQFSQFVQTDSRQHQEDHRLHHVAIVFNRFDTIQYRACIAHQNKHEEFRNGFGIEHTDGTGSEIDTIGPHLKEIGIGVDPVHWINFKRALECLVDVGGHLEGKK